MSECGPASENSQIFRYCCKSEVNEIWKILASENNSRFRGILYGRAAIKLRAGAQVSLSVSAAQGLVLFVDIVYLIVV